MKKVLMVFVALLFVGCSNSNARVELSSGSSDLVGGVKRYAGYSFTIYEIEIDGVQYLANSQGGIVKK